MINNNIKKNLSQYSDVLTINELCEYMNISRNTAYKFLKENNIKYAKVGRVYKISKISLSEYLGVNK